jgi:hypothetical protein
MYLVFKRSFERRKLAYDKLHSREVCSGQPPFVIHRFDTSFENQPSS